MPAPDDNDRRAKANVWRLAAAVALAGANGAAIFAIGGIVGVELAPEPALATLPLSIYVVGVAAGTLPAGAIARSKGRRVVFILGTGMGCLSSLFAALAIVRGSFGLFCLATFLGGLYGAVAQSFRFAAADGASEAFRPRAVAWVMAGGVLAGVLGPQLVTWTMDYWAPYLFAASFLAQAVVALVAMAVVAQVDLEKPRAGDSAGARPLSEIIRQPSFISAAICGVVSYALMNFVMTSAPLAMQICGFGPADSNQVIQGHIVAMYLPSFFTGALIGRFGAPAVVATGLCAIAAAAATGLAGISFGHFSIGLILLGAGWNFGFIGASAMVLETHRPSERNKVQAFNDFVVFGVMALGSFSSGELLALYGWASVNWVVFPPVVLALAMLTLAARARRMPQAALP
jgi:predicted MFS family arabinose efflux permease